MQCDNAVERIIGHLLADNRDPRCEIRTGGSLLGAEADQRQHTAQTEQNHLQDGVRFTNPAIGWIQGITEGEGICARKVF